jgi:hypothetical protein
MKIQTLLPSFAGVALVLSLGACDDKPRKLEPVCAEDSLPLQNPRSHTLGETFYLPSVLQKEECPYPSVWRGPRWR